MKKIYLLFLLVLGMCMSYAQVSTYSFAATSGTYVPITGGSIIGQATIANPGSSPESATMDDFTYENVALSFPFNFNGAAYTSVNINTNGWIGFGTFSNSTSTPISTLAGLGAVSAFANDMMGIFAAAGTTTSGSNILTAVSNTTKAIVGAPIQGTGIPVGATITAYDATTITISAAATSTNAGTFISWTTGEIRVETLGSAPNRIFVIQFKGMSEYSGSTGTLSNTSADFQIRLNEGGAVAANQTVEIVYGEVFRAAGSETIQVGLRGTVTSDYNNRTSTTIWSGTTAGGSNSANVAWSSTVNPANGQTYTWTPSTGPAMDYVNLQFPQNATFALGGTTTIYTRGYEPGVTEAAGAGANITVWIGANSINTNPATWTAWAPATFNVQVGNDDEFMTTVGLGLGAGTYYYASRWQINGGPYRYGGYPGGFWDGVTNVNGVLTITPLVANDICSGAQALTVNPDLACTATTSGTTVGASLSPEIPAPSCSATGINDDVWYSFVATGSGHRISVSGATNTTAIQVYSGGCGSFTLINCLSTSSGSVSMDLNSLTAGQTYLIRAYTTTSTLATTSNFNLCVGTLPPPPVNDICANALILTANTTCVPQTFNMLGATDNNESGDCTAGTEKAVWFKFIATQTNATVTVNGVLGFDAVLGVLNACGATATPTGGACIDATGDDGIETLSLTGLTVGNTYLIQVYEYDGEATTAAAFDICITAVSCPVPTAVTTGGISSAGASVSWTGTGSFILEYGPAGFTPGTGTTAGAGGTVINPATSSQAINGLSVSTGYDVYVRQDCTGAGAGISGNSSVTSFTTFAAPPANNECSGAIVAGSTPTAGTTLNATQSQSAEICGTFTSSAANDVWYQFTATANGAATVTVSGVTVMDVVLQAYSGTCGALTNIACADATAGTAAEVMVLNGLVLGQTYYLRVYGYNGLRGTFDIAITGAAVPVTIEYFKGSRQSGGNLLDWKVSCYNSPTATMVLERSTDSRKFNPINSITETATRCLQPFSFVDASPLAGVNYYRLKTIDADGKASYSTIVALINKDKGFEIVNLMPNPVKATAILSIISAEKTTMQVLVSDLAGRQLSKQQVMLNAGSNQVPLMLAKLAAGTYQVTGITADGNTTTLRFVKD